jgi:hypothetical protein
VPQQPAMPSHSSPPSLSVASVSALASVHRDGVVVLGVVLGLALFVTLVSAFMRIPHLAVAATIPYFALLPMFERFVSGRLGGTKDVVTLAAGAAAGIILVKRRFSHEKLALDLGVVVTVALLLLLYAANIGGAVTGASRYGWQWFHGVRLIAEPLALLLAGMTLPQPRRTLRWAIASLAATGGVVAAYGVVQQALGVDRLVRLGYVYGQEVREIGPHLRSFGTLEDPFAYASFLLLCVVVLLFGCRIRWGTFALIALVSCGVVVSFVRTAAVTALFLLGLALIRRVHGRVRIVLAVSAALAAVVAVTAVTVPTKSLGVGRYVPPQSRADLWKRALGHSAMGWTLGRGVGSAGTASQRASQSLFRSAVAPPAHGVVVDSSYVVTVSDVGVVGLVVLVALLTRLLVLARRRAASGDSCGWMALGILVVVIFDALTRESLTGFPTAYLEMLTLGLTLATVSSSPPDSLAK